MRTVNLFGLRVRMHLAFPAMLLVGVMGGDGLNVLLLICLLALHELAHAVVARMLGVRVVEVELMPFGGAARLENAWGLRPGQMLLVALAGPVMNALLFLLTLLLWRNGALSPFAAWLLLWNNALLCVFNLIPALPLDGGRVLCGLLGRRMGQERAARIGVWVGRVLAALLLSWVCLGILLAGTVNLTILFCAIFILASGGREQIAAGTGSLMSLIDRKGEMADEGALPVRWIAVNGDARLRTVIAGMRPRVMHRVAVYDENMRFAGVVEEDALLRAALEDSGAAVQTLI